ncbi:Protein kinase-like domain [Pseudocohnilembus persalinus]|uniref:Protein kinase-like domain n=1 Tax=Pseudocohnilembus persalinus TaxID=266149 RepID=A0A0V0QMY7_PSEPJ|nr:Protein kinase-like domain [Pseudocohnilembus persalinus]|eukprot:KRX03328.1 Protein kinase-like domain [Pseudocohnilembus persalinus]
MEELLQNVGKLEQIGKSNNSVIYKLLNKEGKPNGKVLKIVMHNEEGTHPKECEHLHNEANMLQNIKHPSIIRNHGTLMANQNLKNSHFCALQMELADTDFFDKIAKMYPNPVEPKYIRSAFLQVLNALDYLHNEMGIAHNDIKLENIFLLKNKIKLADFGFASLTDKSSKQTPQEQQKLWKNRCKTPLSPEILNLIQGKSDKNFSEKKADIFALGVSIFQSLFLRAPFQEDYANENDQMFKYFFSNQHSKFWEIEEIANTLKYLNQFEDFRQEAFIDLINKMLSVNPDKRLNVKQIMKHPWFRSSNVESSNHLAGCTQF